MNPHHVTVRDVRIGNDLPLVLIAGPCALESRAHALEISAALVEITARLGIPLIYKTSFDKANRTSLSGARGVGFEAGLPILAEIRETRGIPVLTDVHLPEQCAPTAASVDVLQIPAYLCRQTDLLIAAARTGAAINVKKGQFLAPWDMKNVAGKISGTGNQRILLCERGASFGYNTLVSDMRVIAGAGRDRLPRRVRRDAFGAAARRTGRERVAASGALSRHWRAPRSRSGSPRSSWRRTRTPTAPPPTALTWCR